MKKSDKIPGAARGCLKGIKANPTINEEESRDDALNKKYNSWDDWFEKATPMDADILAEREQVLDGDRRCFSMDEAMYAWVNTPNIALDGLTPGQAVKTEDGQAKVIELVQVLTDH